MGHPDETVPEILRGVFLAGALPILRALPAVWRWAGRRPARAAAACLATPFVLLGLLLYVLSALVVPLSFGCLLVLVAPVAACVLVMRLIERMRTGSTPSVHTGNTVVSATATPTPQGGR